MIKKTIRLLDEITNSKAKKENRRVDILKNPTSDHTEGWYMLVKSCFNNALDIKMTEIVKDKICCLVWTQGRSFTFDTGDVLYVNQDIDQTYSQTNIRHYVQIQSASNVTPPNNDTDRFPGSVFFWEMVYDVENRTVIMKKDWVMSQDDFVRFLIVGPPIP